MTQPPLLSNQVGIWHKKANDDRRTGPTKKSSHPTRHLSRTQVPPFPRGKLPSDCRTFLTPFSRCPGWQRVPHQSRPRRRRLSFSQTGPGREGGREGEKKGPSTPPRPAHHLRIEDRTTQLLRSPIRRRAPPPQTARIYTPVRSNRLQ